MPRKKAGSQPVNIQRLSERRLLDSKILAAGTGSEPSRAAVVSAILGFLVGGGILAYLFFSKTPVEPNYTPSVIVPQNQELKVSPPPSAQEPTTTPEASAPKVVSQNVEILDTPTGFLNVRSGPGTSFTKVAQIKPGESYEFISQDETKGWVQIKLSENTSGWISKQYARIK